MPKSKKRGGEKAHRKRVKRNNAVTQAKIQKAQKEFQDAMMEQINSFREKLSAETQTEDVSSDSVGFIQPTETL